MVKGGQEGQDITIYSGMANAQLNTVSKVGRAFLIRIEMHMVSRLFTKLKVVRFSKQYQQYQYLYNTGTILIPAFNSEFIKTSLINVVIARHVDRQITATMIVPMEECPVYNDI